jgi:hypothetical protein
MLLLLTTNYQMNKKLLLFFDFYIKSSLHVALAVVALVAISQQQFELGYQIPLLLFSFFGTVVGYNFVKYDALVRLKSGFTNADLFPIVWVSGFSFVGGILSFFYLSSATQWFVAPLLILTIIYTLPIYPTAQNARNWAGVKIYIVTMCWVGVTLVLPLVDENTLGSTSFYICCLQRFVFVFVLILIFEIIDLQFDHPELKTIPQQIGVANTQGLGLLLLVVFVWLGLFVEQSFSDFMIALVVAIVIGLFLIFANPNRTWYYTAFWVECVPILWWLLMTL